MYFPYNDKGVSKILVHNSVVVENVLVNYVSYIVHELNGIFLESSDHFVKILDSAKSIDSIVDPISM